METIKDSLMCILVSALIPAFIAGLALMAYGLAIGYGVI